MTLKIKGLITLLLLLVSGFAWWSAYESHLPPPAKAADGYEEMMARLHPLGIPAADFVRCDNPRARLRCKNGICTTSTNAEACIFYGGVLGPVVFTATATVTATVEAATPAPGETPSPVAAPAATTPTPPPTPIVYTGPKNLLYNGNFEYGFYQVPQLGFEIPDVGNVPNDWQWYRNPAYGKYNINNNQTLGLHCADDLTPEMVALLQQQAAEENEGFGPYPGYTPPEPNNAAMFQIQSSDQQDARMGIYQVVNVVPGQTYRFSMSGTIQIQSGASTLQPTDPEAPREDQNHTVELFFDYRGGTDWKAIPQEEKIILPWKEDDVLFRYESDEDEGKGISPIEAFETLVTARTNKLTIFIGAWRKWANWRSGHITIDCVSLVPGNRLLGGGASGGQPAAAGQSGPGLPTTGEDHSVPNYIITGQGLQESPRFGRITR